MKPFHPWRCIVHLPDSTYLQTVLGIRTCYISRTRLPIRWAKKRKQSGRSQKQMSIETTKLGAVGSYIVLTSLLPRSVLQCAEMRSSQDVCPFAVSTWLQRMQKGGWLPLKSIQRIPTISNNGFFMPTYLCSFVVLCCLLFLFFGCQTNTQESCCHAARLAPDRKSVVSWSRTGISPLIMLSRKKYRTNTMGLCSVEVSS